MDAEGQQVAVRVGTVHNSIRARIFSECQAGGLGRRRVIVAPGAAASQRNANAEDGESQKYWLMSRHDVFPVN